MNIYDPTFSSSQVALAAGMTPTNFRAHLARGNWRIIGDSQPAEAVGKGHLFSIYEALGYALANELVQLGVDPKVAFERAMFDFAHTSDGDRKPGGVFDPEKHGVTLFIYVPGAAMASCVSGKSISDGIQMLIPPGQRRGSSAVIVCLNDLRKAVFHGLGLNAQDYD